MEDKLQELNFKLLMRARLMELERVLPLVTDTENRQIVLERINEYKKLSQLSPEDFF